MNQVENKSEDNSQTQQNQKQPDVQSANESTAEANQQQNQQIVSQDEKLFGAIAYLNLGCLLTLAMKPKSQFCQFHAKQGVILFIAFFVSIFVLALIPFIGFLLFLLLFFAIVGLSVFGALNAFQGKMWKLPYLSQYTGKIDLSKLDSIPFPNLPQKNAETKKEEKSETVETQQDHQPSNEGEKKEEK